MGEQQPFTLPAGTVCKRNGIPFKLQHATQIECHPDNWELIKGEPPEAIEVEATSPLCPLDPTGAEQLIPLLERLCDLLEKQLTPLSITYSFATADDDGEKKVAAAKAAANDLVQQAGAMLAALHVGSPPAAFSPAEIVSMAWDRNLQRRSPSEANPQADMSRSKPVDAPGHRLLDRDSALLPPSLGVHSRGEE
jgi:hypothetical protein